MNLVSFTLFIVDIILILFFSLFISSLIKDNNIPSYLLSIYILASTNIIITTEAAGILNLLNNRLFYLFVHLVLFLFAILIWRFNRKPNLFLPLIKAIKKERIKMASLKILDDPQIAILVFFTIILYLFSAYLIIKVPPNNYDSMTCHMARVGYWLQHGNFWPWPTWNHSQIIYPINSGIQILWATVFLGNDRLAGFPQWFASIMGIISIYGITRVLGWKQNQSIFASFVWALLPEILLESTTTQNHLLASTYFITSIYFIFLFYKKGRFEYLVFSSLSLCISLGTHQLTFITLPSLAIVILILSMKNKNLNKKVIFHWIGLLLISFILVGSFMYFVNLFNYGNPFINKNDIVQSDFFKLKFNSFKGFMGNFFSNAFKYLYTSFDLTGLPGGMSESLYEIRTKITKVLLNDHVNLIETNGFMLDWKPKFIHEDTAWFGIIGFFILTPLFIYCTIKSFIRKDLFQIGIFIIVGFYFIIWAGFLFWSKFQGRYFIVIASLMAPSFACLINEKQKIFKTLSYFVVIISIILAINIMINSHSKPLKGENSIWGKSRNFLQTINAPVYLNFFNVIDHEVPQDARIGLALNFGNYEYPFFGKYLKRYLVTIYPNSLIEDSNWINSQNFDWIVNCSEYQVIPRYFSNIKNINIFQQNCALLKKHA